MVRSCRAPKYNAAAASHPCSQSWARYRPRTDRSCGGERTAVGPEGVARSCSNSFFHGFAVTAGWTIAIVAVATRTVPIAAGPITFALALAAGIGLFEGLDP